VSNIRRRMTELCGRHQILSNVATFMRRAMPNAPRGAPLSGVAVHDPLSC